MTEESTDLAPTAGENPSVQKAAHDLRVAAGESAKQVAHSAEERARQLKEAASKKAQQFREYAGEKAEHAKETAGDKVGQIRHAAGEQWEDTRIRARELHGQIEDYVRQNPTRAVLAAGGIGVLIGLLVRR
jgi:ElaB/YqjD/DUF883 family membrane-anchored ribosome-binding protein